MRPLVLQPTSLPPFPRIADNDADALPAGIGLYTHHKYQKALHSPVPLDPHGNPLPQEEAEEILQTAVRLDFPPEEGFIGGDVEQYGSPDEDEGYERERRNGVEPHIEGDGGLLPRHERQ